MTHTRTHLVSVRFVYAVGAYGIWPEITKIHRLFGVLWGGGVKPVGWSTLERTVIS